MCWYLVHTKPRQGKCAQENLERQGYECYLPVFPKEKLRQSSVVVANEPLFPRYLFIRNRSHPVFPVMAVEVTPSFPESEALRSVRNDDCC